jgi:asparaginyl-tRNA synthetase
MQYLFILLISLHHLTMKTTSFHFLNRGLFSFKSLRPLSSAVTSDNSLKRIKINKILVDADQSLVGKQLVVKGWVRTIRDQKQFAFIEVNDGSTLTNLQVIADNNISTYADVLNITTGSAVSILGTLVASSGKGQKFELQAKEVEIVGPCPSDTYPLQKKKHSQEYLRSMAHLRPRTNTISAVARIRSAVALATHQFFQKEGFLFVQTPLITASDCEGAGELFRVTTLPIEKPDSIPRSPANKSMADFQKDFFHKPTFLTVSGQLSAETYACALSDVYTFGPTFRAEHSQTTKHLAEFHMIEPEMAFTDYHEAMDNAEKYLKHIVQTLLENPNTLMDLQFFQKFYAKNLITRLEQVVNKPFHRLLYREAVDILHKEIHQDKKHPEIQWNYPNVSFGTDLQTEHERFLSEKYFDHCVFIYNYPKEIKAFYMKDSQTHPQTVDSFDLLVPGIGELIGGSQREDNYDLLVKKIRDGGLKESDYSWYLDLRKYGSVPHSGYGVGFERLICYLTGIDNIREAIAYPRSYGSADF